MTNIDKKYGDSQSPLGVKKALESFHEKLDEITKEITKRNETRKMPYDVMLPNSIPQSINI
jgi:hypothetical protein